MRQAGVAANMPSSTKIDAVLETLDQIRGVRRCSCGKQKSALLEAAVQGHAFLTMPPRSSMPCAVPIAATAVFALVALLHHASLGCQFRHCVSTAGRTRRRRRRGPGRLPRRWFSVIFVTLGSCTPLRACFVAGAGAAVLDQGGRRGLNLTCACRIILTDVWWNSAHEDQVQLLPFTPNPKPYARGS